LDATRADGSKQRVSTVLAAKTVFLVIIIVDDFAGPPSASSKV
jgi:hypothetical protein